MAAQHPDNSLVLGLLLAIVLMPNPACRNQNFLQRRYDRAVNFLRNGNLKEASRLAALNVAGDAAWHARFRLLTAEIMLAEGQAERALPLLDSATSDSLLEARRLMLQGSGLLKIDRYSDASRVLQEAAKRAASLQALDLPIEIDLLEGRLLTMTNQVGEAGRLLQSAQMRAAQMHDPYLQSTALNGLAVNEMRIFHWDRALSFAAQALSLAKQIGAEHLEAGALGNLGYCAAYLGNFEKARAYSKEAIALSEKEDDLMGLQNLFGALGSTYLLEGDAQGAIPYYRQAFSIARQLNAISYASTWRANLAEALAEAGDWEAASQLAWQSEREGYQDEQNSVSALLTKADISVGRREFLQAERYLAQVIDSHPKNPAQLWEAHAGLGSVYVRTGQLRRAGTHFEQAIRLIETTRSEIFQAEHRATFLSRWIRWYQDYVDLLIDRGDFDKAFQISELSRARVLGETLGWRQLPRQPASLAAYQHAAARIHAALLSYWIAPQRSILWVITAAGTRTFLLPDEKQIAAHVEAYRKSIEELREPSERADGPGGQLYSELLGKVGRLIPAGSKVILAPDGPLHNLNFETLPVPPNSTHYWIEDVTVSVTPSLSFALGPPKVGPSLPESLLLIGDPESASPDYPKLTYASKEVGTIERIFPYAPKTVLTGPLANPDVYRSAQPQHFSMIHFAAHGLANRASPLDSAVILSPKDGEFLLSARDISEQPLRAKLVTIASCRSAGAKSFPGEGPLGLAWAFLRAGAEHVIAGLWDVNDRSTFEIMAGLYASVAMGKSPEEALHSAKLAILRRNDRFREPYYWGPFQDYIAH